MNEQLHDEIRKILSYMVRSTEENLLSDWKRKGGHQLFEPILLKIIPILPKRFVEYWAESTTVRDCNWASFKLVVILPFFVWGSSITRGKPHLCWYDSWHISPLRQPGSEGLDFELRSYKLLMVGPDMEAT